MDLRSSVSMRMRTIAAADLSVYMMQLAFVCLGLNYAGLFILLFFSSVISNKVYSDP